MRNGIEGEPPLRYTSIVELLSGWAIVREPSRTKYSARRSCRSVAQNLIVPLTLYPPGVWLIPLVFGWNLRQMGGIIPDFYFLNTYHMSIWFYMHQILDPPSNFKGWQVISNRTWKNRTLNLWLCLRMRHAPIFFAMFMQKMMLQTVPDRRIFFVSSTPSG